MIEEELQSLGLTEGESKAYLAMLQIGTSTVGPIAKKSGISYSKIYEVLQRLTEKGIVSFIIKDNKKYFQAVEPKVLKIFLDKQEEEIRKNREKLKKIVPELEKRAKSNNQGQKAEIFVGLRGLRAANEKMFSEVKKGDTALFLYVYKEEYLEIVDEFYSKIAPYYKEIKIKFDAIGAKEWVKSKYVRENKSLINARHVNFPLPGTIDIYKDMVLEVSWGKEPTAILIKSQEIADNYKNYFKELWKIAKI